MATHSKQFSKIDDHDRVAFKAYLAVWNDLGNPCHIAIAAPTVEMLADVWLKITGFELDKIRAQEVLFLERA